MSGAAVVAVMWVGFAGQMLLQGRWVLQWAVSERRRTLVIPILFWWMSAAGASMMAAYGFAKHDWVIVVGQPLSVAIYTRNLWMIAAEARRRGIWSRERESDTDADTGRNRETPTDAPDPARTHAHAAADATQD